jgi:hypothetical protein
MGLMLPVIILSGFIFPLSSILPLQVISNIIPAKWFIIIIKAYAKSIYQHYMERNINSWE